MRRVIHWGIWTLFVVASAVNAQVVGTQVTPSNTHHSSANSFLWKIEKPDQPVSYLLGTIHLGKEKSQLSSQFVDILKRTSVLVTEVNVMPEDDEMNDMGLMLIDYSFDLSKTLSGDYYFALQQQLSSVMPNEYVKHVKPWAAFAMIAYSKPDGYSELFGLDMLLTKEAKTLKKTRVFLETLEDSLRYFADLPEERVISIIQVILDHYDDAQSETQELIQLYQTNQVDEVVNMLSGQSQLLDYFSEDEKRFWQNWFHQKLLMERNRNWLPKLEQQLAKESSLVAVGAGHLFGDEGLINLLKTQGYQLTPVAIN